MVFKTRYISQIMTWYFPKGGCNFQKNPLPHSFTPLHIMTLLNVVNAQTVNKAVYNGNNNNKTLLVIVSRKGCVLPHIQSPE